MNKTVTIALASLLAISPAAGVAYAQETLNTMEAPDQAQGNPVDPADTLATGSISSDNVEVVVISSMTSDSTNSAELSRLEALSTNVEALDKAQADLQANPGLADVLASKNVQLNNVVEVQTAPNGGTVVYVK